MGKSEGVVATGGWKGEVLLHDVQHVGERRRRSVLCTAIARLFVGKDSSCSSTACCTANSSISESSRKTGQFESSAAGVPSRLIDTSDHWATAQRRFEGKQPTKLNDDDAPPPVLPTRTSESFQIEPAGGDDAMPSSSGPRSRRPALTSTEKKNLEGHRTRGNKFGSAARDGRGGGTSPPSATTPTSNSNRTEMPEDLGFKNRVPRPRGPRPMPSNWRTFQ